MFHMDLLQPKYIDTNMYTLHFINQIRFAEYRLFFMISVSLLAVPLSEQQSQGVPRIKTVSEFALHRMVHNIYTSNNIYIYQVYLFILCSLNWLIADVMCNFHFASHANPISSSDSMRNQLGPRNVSHHLFPGRLRRVKWQNRFHYLTNLTSSRRVATFTSSVSH